MVYNWRSQGKETIGFKIPTGNLNTDNSLDCEIGCLMVGMSRLNPHMIMHSNRKNLPKKMGMKNSSYLCLNLLKETMCELDNS